MASARDIKRRIKGIKNTGKITRAMEMISAVKMRRAMADAVALRPYASTSFGLLHQLTAALGADTHPLISVRPVRSELLILCTSNRGLCGSFNAQVLKQYRAKIKANDAAGIETVCVVIGRKGEAAVKRSGKKLLASFTEIKTITAESVRPVALVALSAFQSGDVDRVSIVYTNFVSALSQVATTAAVLPTASISTALTAEVASGSNLSATYVFEPSAASVVESVVPRLVESLVLHALLESRASEESSRMAAMKNATEAAKDIAGWLTLSYNQLRQAKITQEIAELSAGMAAVE